MASAVNAASSFAATSAPSSTSSSSSGLGGAAPTEGMFLQLLVAQLQNQDPLNPTDGTQFVSQLAQFSELEQVIGIRSDIEKPAAAAAAQGAAASQSGADTNSTQKTQS